MDNPQERPLYPKWRSLPRLFPIVLAAAATLWLRPAEAEGQTPAELFKTFVASPPLISNLVFAVQRVKTNFYHIRYQPNALFVGTSQLPLASENSLDAYQSAVSRFDEVYWRKFASDFYIWTNRNILAEKGNSVEHAYSHALAVEVPCVLNMGFQFAPPGSIRWSGDTFAVTNEATKLWYSGELRRDVSQRAAKLIVEERKLGHGPGRSAERVLTYNYFYERPLSLSYIPSSIRVSTGPADSDSHQPAFQIRISEIQVGEIPLPKPKFSFIADQWKHDEQVFVVSNRNLIYLADQRSIVIPDPHQDDQGHRQKKARQTYLTVAIVVAALVPVVFWFHRRSVS